MPRNHTHHRYGWRRDLPDARDLPFSVPAAVLAALPARVDLREPGVAPVLDRVAELALGGDRSLRDVLKTLRGNGDGVVEYLRLPQSLVHLKGCLAAGRPFVFGFSMYESFERNDVRTTGMVPVPAARERLLAGHAAVAVGYDDDEQRFVVRNSWGVDWGDRGDCYLPYAYITNGGLAADFWTLGTAEE